jgi:DNA-binding GntR family transcriptional regulator
MPTTELVRQLTADIQDLIQGGALPPNEHVTTQGLASRFGVSRSPVREAMQILADRGLLEQKRNRGFFVTAINGGNDSEAEHIALGDEAFVPQSNYQRIAEDWLTDQIPSEVTEQTLRQRYGLTKAQLSDILIRAAREGWAERKQGYGWRFLPVAKTPESFEQIYRFRLQIEPSAMLEPGFTIDRSVLRDQRAVQQRMLDTDIRRLLQNGSIFHEELIKMSGNPFFYSALVQVNRMRRLLEYRASVNHERLRVQCSEHLQIITLLEQGEIIEASYMMRRHLSGALDRKSPIAWEVARVRPIGHE